MSDSDEPLKDEAFSADMLLIEELVDELGLDHRPADSETILEVGNLEDTRVLAIRHGLFTSRPPAAASARLLLRSTPPVTLAAT